MGNINQRIGNDISNWKRERTCWKCATTCLLHGYLPQACSLLHTHSISQTHTNTHTVSLSLLHTHTNSISLSYTHIDSLSLSAFFSCKQTIFAPFFSEQVFKWSMWKTVSSTPTIDWQTTTGTLRASTSTTTTRVIRGRSGPQEKG